MALDPETCYRAIASRDARFDGRFFTGVTTTDIYCRPVCPARTPRQENVRFFACAAAAEAAGFRPCRRCRPESAPGTPPWLGTSALVSRALRLIERGALDGASVESLAARLGVGDRHLRRLFVQHLGAAPRSVALSRRAHFARELIDRTDLVAGEVAHASGFGSVRQFNEVFRAIFGETPTEARRRRGEGPAGAISLRLGLRPPFDWEGLLAFLGPRAVPEVEAVDSGRYRRTFSAEGKPGWLEVGCEPDRRALRLDVRGGAVGSLLGIARRVRRLFDLDADPLLVSARLAGSGRLGRAFAERPGLRVPGAFDPFETLVRAILGQQVSVRAATTLAGRLVERFGGRLEGAPAGMPDRLFPAPAALAEADVGAIGLPAARAQAVRAAAAAVASGALSLEPNGSLESLVERLEALPGIGRWTAHYLALRLGEPDAFPADDLGLRRAAGARGAPLPASTLLALAEAWRPFRAYAAVHLWASHAQERRRAKEKKHADHALVG